MLNHYDRERIIWGSSYEPFTKMLLLALNSFVDGNGECWPGQDTLAEMCGMNRRSVIRKLQSLEDDGVLVVSDRYDTYGRQTSNLYRVDFEQLGRVTESHPGVTQSHEEGDTESPRGCQRVTGEGDTESHDLSNLDLSNDLPKDLSLSKDKPGREREELSDQELRTFVRKQLKPSCKVNLEAYVNAALRNDRDIWVRELS